MRYVETWQFDVFLLDLTTHRNIHPAGQGTVCAMLARSEAVSGRERHTEEAGKSLMRRELYCPRRVTYSLFHVVQTIETAGMSYVLLGLSASQIFGPPFLEI